MGLLKNDDRRSARREAKKRSKPLGQAVETTVAEPGSAARKNVLQALSDAAGARRTEGQEANGPRGAGSVTTYLPVEEDQAVLGDAVGGGPEPVATPAQREAAVRRIEATTLSLHLHAEPTLVRPTVPEPEPPDPQSERERIERQLGIPELASSLAPYGTPPVAPPMEPADRDTLARERLRETSAGVSRWKVGARRSLREEAREQAARERERLAAEQKRLQEELDASWDELATLRERAARELDEWLQQEMGRREAQRAEQQAALDRAWQQQVDADPDSVTAALRAEFPEDAVRVLGYLDRVAVLVVACPDIDEVIALREPAFTSAGRPTVRPRTETRRNDLYLSAIASHILAAVGRAISTAPGVAAVSCVAVRAAKTGAHR